MTSANLLVVLLISIVVGALVGLGLGGVITHPLWLGLISGFLATILAGMARNYLVSRGVLGPCKFLAAIKCWTLTGSRSLMSMAVRQRLMLIRPTY